MINLKNQECWLTLADIENGAECSASLNGICPLNKIEYLKCTVDAFQKKAFWSPELQEAEFSLHEAMQEKFCAEVFLSNI